MQGMGQAFFVGSVKHPVRHSGQRQSGANQQVLRLSARILCFDMALRRGVQPAEQHQVKSAKIAYVRLRVAGHCQQHLPACGFQRALDGVGKGPKTGMRVISIKPGAGIDE